MLDAFNEEGNKLGVKQIVTPVQIQVLIMTFIKLFAIEKIYRLFRSNERDTFHFFVF